MKQHQRGQASRQEQTGNHAIAVVGQKPLQGQALLAGLFGGNAGVARGAPVDRLVDSSASNHTELFIPWLTWARQ